MQNLISSFWHPRAKFFIKCIAASSIVMCLSMVLGELIAGKNLFGGFTSEPQMWMWVIIETCAWMAPFIVLALMAHSLFRRYFKTAVRFFSNICWVILAGFMLALYAVTYVTKPWHMREISPGVLFGWMIPSALICYFFARFSKDLYRES